MRIVRRRRIWLRAAAALVIAVAATVAFAHTKAKAAAATNFEVVVHCPGDVVTAGHHCAFDVTAKDNSFATDTMYQGTASFSVPGDAAASVPGNYTFSLLDQGHKSFPLAMDGSGGVGFMTP